MHQQHGEPVQKTLSRLKVVSITGLSFGIWLFMLVMLRQVYAVSSGLFSPVSSARGYHKHHDEPAQCHSYNIDFIMTVKYRDL